jgi:cytochrome c oxidase assembly protein subunit 15
VRLTLKWLTMATCLGMFLVLIAGVLVTKTESGRGCGDDWPLCNGKFIPAYTLESMIEYSHRAISGIVGILVIVTAISIYRKFNRRSEPFFYASGALLFTVLQAILGAMAVVWEQSSAIMALHFGFSLLAFSFTLLLVLQVWKHNKISRPSPYMLISPLYRKLVWFVTLYTYAVVYIGAFVRHTESSGGCLGWPLCNGEFIPELTGFTGIAFIHRVAAMLLFLLIIGLTILGKRLYNHIPEIGSMSMLVLILTFMQVLSGAWVTTVLGTTNMYVFASLVHTMIIAALFAVLSYMSVRVWHLQIK